MAARLRDTQFGQLVRWLTSERLMRYPDEDNPSSWRKALTRGHAAAQGLGTLEDDEVKVLDTDYGTHDAPSAMTKAEAQKQADPAASGTGTEDAEKDDGEAHLVDWYDPADPEASI